MPTLNRNTLYFRVEWEVINPQTKTLQLRPDYSLHWDDNASQYSTPQLSHVSDSLLQVRCHIGEKVAVTRDGEVAWFHEDVLSPCEKMLKEQGYTPVPFGLGG